MRKGGAINDRRRQIRSHAGMRGVAALFVVAYHLQFGGGVHLGIEDASPLFRRGYLMVDLFFVLSGFIISYADQGDRAMPFSARQYRDFLVRRLIRLYPLAAFCLLALLLFRIAVAALEMFVGRAGASVWGNDGVVLLVSQLLLLNAWLPDPNGWNVPSWSISAEMFAYLLFPLIVGLHAVRPRVSLMLLLALPAIFYGAVAVTTGSLDIIGFPSPLRCLAGFLLGMAIFYGRERIARLPSPLLSIGQIAAMAAIGLCMALPVNDVAIVPAFALLVAFTWTDEGPIAGLLSRPGAQRLGDLSYSIYLTHVPVLLVVGTVWLRTMARLPLDPLMIRAGWIATCFGVTLLVSSLTFRFVERPASRWLRERWRRDGRGP